MLGSKYYLCIYLFIYLFIYLKLYLKLVWKPSLSLIKTNHRNIKISFYISMNQLTKIAKCSYNAKRKVTHKSDTHWVNIQGAPNSRHSYGSYSNQPIGYYKDSSDWWLNHPKKHKEGWEIREKLAQSVLPSTYHTSTANIFDFRDNILKLRYWTAWFNWIR